MFSVVSRKNAALRAAAWSGSKGGHSLVFDRPAWGALAMTPMAQLRSNCTA
jgi:hypothetical protein